MQLGGPLRLEDVIEIAAGAPAALSEEVLGRVDAARKVVMAALEAGSVVYGVTTGFGSLADVRLTSEHATALQHGLLRSHAVAVGDELPREEVRAMLALRTHVLALGHSGVRREVVLRFAEMLNKDLLPVVPEQGSLGASGDLAPLAHLALPVIGEGEVHLAGERLPAAEALSRCGLEPLVLEAKEGLALINGTQAMTAIGALAASRAAQLAKVADISASLTIEAIFGTDRAFDARVVGLRPHPGQMASGAQPHAAAGGKRAALVAPPERPHRPRRLFDPLRATGPRSVPRRGPALCRDPRDRTGLDLGQSRGAARQRRDPLGRQSSRPAGRARVRLPRRGDGRRGLDL